MEARVKLEPNKIYGCRDNLSSRVEHAYNNTDEAVQQHSRVTNKSNTNF